MVMVVSQEQIGFVLNPRKLWAAFENKREKNKEKNLTG